MNDCASTLNGNFAQAGSAKRLRVGRACGLRRNGFALRFKALPVNCASAIDFCIAVCAICACRPGAQRQPREHVPPGAAERLRRHAAGPLPRAASNSRDASSEISDFPRPRLRS